MYNSINSTDNISYCPSCGTMLEWDNEIGGYKCVICGYKEYTFAGIPKVLHLKGDSIGLAVGNIELEPCTLYLDKCQEVKFNVNGIEIVADLGNADLSKYEAIEINGHRFERIKEN